LRPKLKIACFSHFFNYNCPIFGKATKFGTPQIALLISYKQGWACGWTANRNRKYPTATAAVLCVRFGFFALPCVFLQSTWSSKFPISIFLAPNFSNFIIKLTFPNFSYKSRVILFFTWGRVHDHFWYIICPSGVILLEIRNDLFTNYVNRKSGVKFLLVSSSISNCATVKNYLVVVSKIRMRWQN